MCGDVSNAQKAEREDFDSFPYVWGCFAVRGIDHKSFVLLPLCVGMFRRVGRGSQGRFSPSPMCGDVSHS